MRRRSLLTALGLAGTAGCLRLQEDTGSSRAGQGGSPSTGPSATTAGSGQSVEENPDAVTLTENWNADLGIDFVWTDRGRFYVTGYSGAAEAQHGSGVQWSTSISYNGIEESIGADAFAVDGRRVVFGYIPDPDFGHGEEGAHFHAYDTVTGEELWTSGAPSDGDHNSASGVTIVDDVAVVAACGYGKDSEQDPLVVGLRIETGEEVWRTDASSLPASFIHYLGAYGGNVYVGTLSGGTAVLDPETGDRLRTEESWTVAKSWGESGGKIHGDTFFTVVRSGDGVTAYPLGTGGSEWSNPDLESITTAPVVDNSLVVVGTDAGEVYAMDRGSGEEQWHASIPGTVGAIASSALRVWVADNETGLAAFDRETGALRHRSTKPVNGSDIAVVNDVLLLGGDRMRAYSIAADP